MSHNHIILIFVILLWIWHITHPVKSKNVIIQKLNKSRDEFRQRALENEKNIKSNFNDD